MRKIQEMRLRHLKNDAEGSLEIKEYFLYVNKILLLQICLDHSLIISHHDRITLMSKREMLY